MIIQKRTVGQTASSLVCFQFSNETDLKQQTNKPKTTTTTTTTTIIITTTNTTMLFPCLSTYPLPRLLGKAVPLPRPTCGHLFDPAFGDHLGDVVLEGHRDLAVRQRHGCGDNQRPRFFKNLVISLFVICLCHLLCHISCVIALKKHSPIYHILAGMTNREFSVNRNSTPPRPLAKWSPQCHGPSARSVD